MINLWDPTFSNQLEKIIYNNIFWGIPILANTPIMAIGVVEFSREGYKIRKVFA